MTSLDVARRCPACDGSLSTDASHLGACDKCELFGCARCKQWTPWVDGGFEDPAFCSKCWAERRLPNDEP